MCRALNEKPAERLCGEIQFTAQEGSPRLGTAAAVEMLGARAKIARTPCARTAGDPPACAVWSTWMRREPALGETLNQHHRGN